MPKPGNTTQDLFCRSCHRRLDTYWKWCPWCGTRKPRQGTGR